jgi:hypothetical protein
MKKSRITAFFLISIAAISSLAHAEPSKTPYAGQENRQIKALSSNEVEGLLKSKGLGYAKSAELNHYPGPLHVMETASKINLTGKQLSDTKSIYREMKSEAIPLGEKIVEKERALEIHFRKGSITETSLQRLVGEIARLRGALRIVHLKYHLKMKKLLSPHQVVLYDKARGYGAPSGAGQHNQHNQHMGR